MAFPIALAIGRTALGIGEAARQKRREESLIQAAYARGRERLNINQLDTRQSVAEGSVARGLAGGGGVQTGGPAPTSDETRKWLGDRWSAPTPYSVAGASDLGGQQRVDLGREQRMGQDELVAQREAALSGVRGAYENAFIGSIAQGASTATQAAGTGSEVEAMRGAGGGATPVPAGRIAPDSPAGGAGMVAAAYGAPSAGASAGYQSWQGIHPVTPWGVGGAGNSGAGTNAAFNVYSAGAS
jgi:hypothetical protein